MSEVCFLFKSNIICLNIKYSSEPCSRPKTTDRSDLRCYQKLMSEYHKNDLYFTQTRMETELQCNETQYKVAMPCFITAFTCILKIAFDFIKIQNGLRGSHAKINIFDCKCFLLIKWYLYIYGNIIVSKYVILQCMSHHFYIAWWKGKVLH